MSSWTLISAFFSGGITCSSQLNKIDLKVILDSTTKEAIGQRIRMSKNDIKSLNKAYSCRGKVSTYGGGNFQVREIEIQYYSSNTDLLWNCFGIIFKHWKILVSPERKDRKEGSAELLLVITDT